MVERVRDTVVVGSGPAGYTAALYASRARLDTLVFQGFESGGQMMLASEVENYPGFGSGVMGPDLMDEFEEQAARFGAEMRPENVERVDLRERPFRLWSEGEEEPVLARSVVVATGAKPKRLGVDGELRFFGKGVSGCATCDAFFFRGKKVAVVGGGDTAMEEALHLARYASEVLIVHRGEALRASRIMLERAKENPRIGFVAGAVEEIVGDGSVKGVWLRTPGGPERFLRVDGLFVAVGQRPASDLFRGQVEIDEDGYVVLKRQTMTSVPGVFAAGEVADKSYRQVATAVGSGCMAAIDAQRWLEADIRSL
ncbi:thioredoxin-disulfide reductase [Rubrobacter tropicus]|uniref:thioredoxin-disulfide reductase n=1 Tax=Rubrobacter tropicus TaxID=2653851 RepID=UPI001D188D83|nr:thioredoxin-disulfide reductase [Rubrobacter tropicus]